MTRGTVLTDEAELLNRQVHPRQHDAAKGALRTAFTPSERHQGLLSTLRGRVAPDEAHRRHRIAELESVGTWPVEVGHAASHQLTCLDDGGVGGLPQDHASIDFNGIPPRDDLSQKALVAQAARKLAERANEIGPLYIP